jgi:large subunit ribosomal protein L19
VHRSFDPQKRGPQDDKIKFEIKIEETKGNDMSNLIIEKLLAKTLRTDIPAFRPGDTVRVHVKIKEGDKERVQAFEGVVIKRDNGPQASFTVRKISFGQGVERIFPIQSKVIDKVDLVRSSKVRRARLFYLRGLRGKAARLRDVEKTAH